QSSLRFRCILGQSVPSRPVPRNPAGDRPPGVGTRLKKKLQRKLDLAGISCRADDPKGGCSKSRSWRIEIWMVEGIEKLSSKLECLTFRNIEVFEDREIEVFKWRPIDRVSASIAVTKLGRSGKTACIEPFVNGPRPGVRVAYGVGSVLKISGVAIVKS